MAKLVIVLVYILVALVFNAAFQLWRSEDEENEFIGFDGFMFGLFWPYIAVYFFIKSAFNILKRLLFNPVMHIKFRIGRYNANSSHR